MNRPYPRTTAVEFLRSDSPPIRPLERDWTKVEAYREQEKRDAR